MARLVWKDISFCADNSCLKLKLNRIQFSCCFRLFDDFVHENAIFYTLILYSLSYSSAKWADARTRCPYIFAPNSRHLSASFSLLQFGHRKYIFPQDISCQALKAITCMLLLFFFGKVSVTNWDMVNEQFFIKVMVSTYDHKFKFNHFYIMIDINKHIIKKTILCILSTWTRHTMVIICVSAKTIWVCRVWTVPSE